MKSVGAVGAAELWFDSNDKYSGTQVGSAARPFVNFSRGASISDYEGCCCVTVVYLGQWSE